jgi:hypothetical protein
MVSSPKAVRLQGAGLDVYATVREALSDTALVVDVVGVRVRVALDGPAPIADGATVAVQTVEVEPPETAPLPRPRRARRPKAARVTPPEGEEVPDAG